jgi:sugar lactone lactonase YvrE
MRTIVSIVAVYTLSASVGTWGQDFIVTTIAGGGVVPTPSMATKVPIGEPIGLATGPDGGIYFTSGYGVYRINSDGTLLRVAGHIGPPGYSGDGGLATSAALHTPAALAFDDAGNLFVADKSNHAVRKITAQGVISTVAGTGRAGYSGDGGAAINARLYHPRALSFDTAGNLYIADFDNCAVRRVTPGGIISTLKGFGTPGSNCDDHQRAGQSMVRPGGLANDKLGNLYVSDTYTQGVLKVTSKGGVSTLASFLLYPDTPPGAQSGGAYPEGLAVDAAGNLCVALIEAEAAQRDRVARITPDGTVTTVAGGSVDIPGDGSRAIQAHFYRPMQTAFDAEANLYVTEGARVRKIDPRGLLSTIAGTGEYLLPPTLGDGGPATSASFRSATGLLVDRAENLFISDRYQHFVRKVSPDGTVSTVAGGGSSYSGETVPATSVFLWSPSGLAIDSDGALYIADYWDVLKVTPKGILSRVAGMGTYSNSPGDGGPARSAGMSGVSSVAIDSSDNLYIADPGSVSVRKVTVGGVISRFAGNGTSGYSGDGGPATSAQLSSVGDIALDQRSNLYITGDGRLRKVTSGGTISTVMAKGANPPLGASATTCQNNSGLWAPAPDAEGNVYYAAANLICRLSPSGVISTIAGDATQPSGSFWGDGGLASKAGIGSPIALATDPSGNLIAGFSDSGVVRLLVPQGTSPVLAVNMTHGADPLQGGTDLEYSISVSNVPYSGSTNGPLAVKVKLAAGVAVESMAGTGWTCTGDTCTRSDVLAAGSAFPAITVQAKLDSSAPVQFDALATISGGGAVYPPSAFDTTTITPLTPLAARGATLSPDATTESLDVTLPAGVAWKASSDVFWIDIIGARSGQGNGTLNISVRPNDGPARVGTITINSRSFTIVQEGSTPTGLVHAGSLAQIASGGGWSTSLTLANLGDQKADAHLDFYRSDGTRPWLPLVYPQQPEHGTTLGSIVDESLDAGSTLVINLPGLASHAAEVGFSQLLTNGNVGGFAIFEIQSSQQQAVVPLETRNAPAYVLAFDETNGVQTGIALANTGGAAVTVKVVARDDSGQIVPTKITSIPLAANAHVSFMLNDTAQGFPEIEGKRGTVEFGASAGGQISVIGLRANGKVITTLPVLVPTGNSGGGFGHVVTGGGWETIFTLVNTSTSESSFTMAFHDEATGGPLPLSLVFPQTGETATAPGVTRTLAAGATLLIRTQGGADPVACSGILSTTGQVGGFAIFQIQSNGQEAVVPLETRAPNAFVLAYDNTQGLTTGVALANLSAQPTSVEFIARDEKGIVVAQNQFHFSANGHASFMLPDASTGILATAGKRGTIEFRPLSGAKFSVLGIRAVTGTSVITTIPVMTK